MDLDITGKRIRNVLLQKDNDNFHNEIYFVFDDIVLIITVDHDTDELIINTQERENDYTNSVDRENEFLSKLIEQRVVSYWLSTNNMGYLDLFILGIEEALPTLFISCAASQLKIREVKNVIE
jgi:hypothetical protein